MKNKTTLIALLLVTAAIWGYVLFKIIDATSDVALVDSSKKKHRSSAILGDSTVQDYSLLLNYRDPFLRTAIAKTVSGNHSAPRKTTPQIRWPNIEYHGFVGSGKAGKVAMLTINHREVLLQQGKSHDGVTLLKFFTDSVQVSFEKAKKNIKVQEG